MGRLVLGLHFAQVGAGAEDFSCARQLDNAHRRVACTLLQGGTQRGNRRAVECVAFVGTIERYACNAADQRGRDRCAAAHINSTAIAVASPPPMQRLAIPRRLPRALSAYSRVVMMRAPVAPIGCPSAQAPPLMFTFRGSRSNSWIAAIGTAANASLISYRSTSLACQFNCASNFCMAPTGANVN